MTGDDGKAGDSGRQLLISCANSQSKVVVSASGNQFDSTNFYKSKARSQFIAGLVPAQPQLVHYYC